MSQEDSTESAVDFPRDIFLHPTDEEVGYFQLVDRARRDADPDMPISNGMAGHAVYILKTFFDHAESHVRICTGKLARAFDGVLAYSNPSLIRSVVRFISKPGTRLSIIIRDDPDFDAGQGVESHPLLAALERDAADGDKVQVLKLNQDTQNLRYHFVVMDERAFRVEHEPDAAKAFVIFGNTEFAKDLVDLFGSMESDCVRLYPANAV
ncbi:MAG: hypothetical protein OXE83_05460 [Gammaproteobacteria bacterium]|nr:hypothetical protein [Gammaproteobacteria bacterium]